MPTAALPPIALRTSPLAELEADLMVVPVFSSESPTALTGLNDAVGLELARARESGEFGGRLFELLVTPIVDRRWRATRVMLIGAGTRDEYGTEVARRVAAAAGYAARARRTDRLAFVLRAGLPDASGDIDVAAFVQATAEGLTLAEFHGGSYKTVDKAPSAPPQLTLNVRDLEDGSPETPRRLQAALDRGRLLGECSNLARGLANEPGNTLTPREFADRASQIVADGGASVDVLDEKAIAALNMGLLLGVAKGSSEPPRLMVFRHTPHGVTSGPVLGLIGKGVTFDTGGISIKPADNMDKMKDDMAGGAAVAAAMRAISALGAPIRVVAVVPTTENMPGGRAMKPGDILKSAEGKTVEVMNTDAEGRLILGDGLWYARKLGATHLVDVATLTGAITVALGKSISGLFGTPPWWVEQIKRVADRTGDRVWPMPLATDYFEQLKSEIADFTNTGGRAAGSITAALFLKEFTGGLPWAHLDIAGTAWSEEQKPFQPKGPTGVTVRTLAELAFSADNWK
ncbi:MAG: leucyl aminopeptidase [Vicinamibacterales bacterium]